MTIFRGQLGAWFLVMFISLLVGKVWGWIGEGRVEFLEQQPPANPRLFHIRLALSLVLSVLFDSFMLHYCVIFVLEQAKADMMVMFGFEFAILIILSTSTAARYGIALVEIYITRQQVKAKMEERRAEIRAARVEAIREHARNGASAPPTDLPDENDVNELEIDVPGWEEKGRWVFYLDLLTDFLKLSVYLAFFAILLTFYGLPIHILRDVVVTIRSFARRIMDFLRYRNATRDMNERYPDASAEEVAREEVCIICREEMVSAQPAQTAPGDAGAGGQPAAPVDGTPRVPDRLRPKKLPCGHILHFACLRSWLERQQNCPTCRHPVVVPFNVAGAAGNNAPGNGGVGPQPNIPGVNQAAEQHGAQGDGAPRARVYQFGPFRIGFGAVRGDLLQNLHQQIHHGNPLPPAANANPAGARQIGFGFGFGRRPPAPAAQTQTPGTSNITNIQHQLQQIEQQITQEITNLRAATEQLQRVRQLQTELDRVRHQHANPTTQHTSSSASTLHPPEATRFETSRKFVAEPETSALSSGDPRLPEGLSIPPGWTLRPLTFISGQSHPAPSVSQNPSATSTQGDAATPQFPPVPEKSASCNSQNGAATQPSTADSLARKPTPTTAPGWMPAFDTFNAQSSQEGANVASEQVSEAGPTTGPSTLARDGEPSGLAGVRSDSPSKGKGRAVSVEEAVDEET